MRLLNKNVFWFYGVFLQLLSTDISQVLDMDVIESVNTIDALCLNLKGFYETIRSTAHNGENYVEHVCDSIDALAASHRDDIVKLTIVINDLNKLLSTYDQSYDPPQVEVSLLQSIKDGWRACKMLRNRETTRLSDSIIQRLAERLGDEAGLLQSHVLLISNAVRMATTDLTSTVVDDDEGDEEAGEDLLDTATDDFIEREEEPAEDADFVVDDNEDDEDDEDDDGDDDDDEDGDEDDENAVLQPVLHTQTVGDDDDDNETT